MAEKNRIFDKSLTNLNESLSKLKELRESQGELVKDLIGGIEDEDMRKEMRKFFNDAKSGKINLKQAIKKANGYKR